MPPSTADALEPGPPLLQIDGATATITLRRPDHANRLEPLDLGVLHQHIAAVNAAPVLVLKLTALGRHFCSGYDIASIAGALPEARFDAMVDAVEDCRAVTIAVIHGGVHGGATDLALACDFRLGTGRAEMSMPAARLGLHFYRRGLERYVSRLGVDTAKRLFLTADRLDATAMRDCGFLTELVADEALATRAEALSQRLAAMAPLALLGMKKHLNHITRGTLDAAALEADIVRTLASNDLREGALAWREKRPARFTGT